MYSLGVDVGSVSTDFVLMDENNRIEKALYLRTHGDPVGTVAKGMRILKESYSDEDISAVGTTGSGRLLAGSILRADAVKNEITSHGVAASVLDPDVKTIIEIGGQDSKIILLEKGVIKDFAMNTVCAAGTGAFLDRQAERMNMTIDDFSILGLQAEKPERIAGRCAVFAESDIIHKQQQGAARADVIAGVANALVRNYLSNVARGKKIREKVFFQGGVSANQTIRRAFEEAIGCEVIVPKYNKVMGAFGAAILASEAVGRDRRHDGGIRHGGGVYGCGSAAGSDADDMVYGCGGREKDGLNGSRGREAKKDVNGSCGSTAESGINCGRGRDGAPNGRASRGRGSACSEHRGAAAAKKGAGGTKFRGFDAPFESMHTRTFRCSDCANHCEVTEILSDDGPMGCLYDRCGKYQNAM